MRQTPGLVLKVLAGLEIDGMPYSNLELCSLDANTSYDFHLQIQDKLYSLSSLDLYFTVPQGTPLIALRKKKVGINTPNPQAALDVAGDMRVDGSPLADFVIQQGTSGIWTYRKWKSGIAECWCRRTVSTALNTLWAIAKKYLGNGSRYKEIVSLNGLKSNVIYSGMKLKIPNK